MTDKTELEVTQSDWRKIALAAGKHGVRYRTNSALLQFFADIGLATRTPDPTPAVPADGLVEAAEMARVILMGVRPGLCMKPGGKVVSAGQALDALEAALAAYRGEA